MGYDSIELEVAERNCGLPLREWRAEITRLRAEVERLKKRCDSFENSFVESVEESDRRLERAEAAEARAEEAERKLEEVHELTKLQHSDVMRQIHAICDGITSDRTTALQKEVERLKDLLSRQAKSWQTETDIAEKRAEEAEKQVESLRREFGRMRDQAVWHEQQSNALQKERDALRRVREQVENIPTREEFIGGQRTKYIQRDEVLGCFDAACPEAFEKGEG